MARQKIIITGAAGNIGRKLIREFEHKYDLVLLDKKRLERKNFVIADLGTYDNEWVKYFEKVSTVIHLAGNPHTDAPWEDLISDNIDSVLNVCQACVTKKVRRLIFASSCHTMGGYKNSEIDLITIDLQPMPDCDYGVSKLMGERICYSYSQHYPISVICLRIGWVPRRKIGTNMEFDAWHKSLWLSDRDLIQIVEKSINVKRVKFRILYAMSSNEGMNWDLRTTMETLNYLPQDGLKV